MTRLGAMIAHEYGRDEFLLRLSHPFWFQSFGAVMGMDRHSSGITASVMGALKWGLGPLASDLGLHVCGGRGRHSRATPLELVAVGGRTGLDGVALAQTSRLVAKVDSAAVQDGFDLYLHGFGARTIRALAMVAEVVHGVPCRFGDPACFSLAHGDKDGHPYPVSTKVYDHTTAVMKSAVCKARIGREEELAALRRLDEQARRLEGRVSGPLVEAVITQERAWSHEYGGRTVFGWESPASAHGPVRA